MQCKKFVREREREMKPFRGMGYRRIVRYRGRERVGDA